MRKLIIFVILSCVIAGGGYVLSKLLMKTPFVRAMADDFIAHTDDPIKEHYRAFLAAKKRWEANPVPHYQWKYSYGEDANHEPCELEVEVEHELLVRVFKDNCSMRGYISTISDLYAFGVRQIPQQIDWINGRGCDLWISRTEIDAQLNYPHHITIEPEWMSVQNIGKHKYTLIRETNFSEICRLLGVFKEPIHVISFMPLP